MRYITVVILLLLSVSHVNAQDYNSTIVGTWSLNIDNTLELMEGSTKTNFDRMSDDKRNDIKNAFSQRKFQFWANGDFQVQWYDGKNQNNAKGYWSASNDNLTVEIDGKSTIYTIREVSNARLARMILVKKTGNVGLFKTLSFNRQ